MLRQELGRVAGEARLRSFEVPRDFLVESVPWTRENGLLTGIGKPARTRLQARYGSGWRNGTDSWRSASRRSWRLPERTPV